MYQARKGVVPKKVRKKAIRRTEWLCEHLTKSFLAFILKGQKRFFDAKAPKFQFGSLLQKVRCSRPLAFVSESRFFNYPNNTMGQAVCQPVLFSQYGHPDSLAHLDQPPPLSVSKRHRGVNAAIQNPLEFAPGLSRPLVTSRGFVVSIATNRAVYLMCSSRRFFCSFSRLCSD